MSALLESFRPPEILRRWDRSPLVEHQRPARGQGKAHKDRDELLHFFVVEIGGIGDPIVDANGVYLIANFD